MRVVGVSNQKEVFDPGLELSMRSKSCNHIRVSVSIKVSVRKESLFPCIVKFRGIV